MSDAPYQGGPPSPLETKIARRFPSLAEAVRGIDGKALFILLFGCLVLLVFRKYGGSGTFEVHLRPDSMAKHAYLTVYGDYYWFLSCFTALFLVPFLVSQIPSLKPARLGLGLGDWRWAMKWIGILFAVMLPVVVIASMFGTFWKYYPLNRTLGAQAAQWLAGNAVPDDFLLHFVIFELLYAVYFIGWEFFFRGYLTFGLYERMGINGALAANIPFALLHLGKPFPEALGSVIAGLALGIFALRARSFWYCFILHAGIAWTMDVAAIYQRWQRVVGG